MSRGSDQIVPYIHVFVEIVRSKWIPDQSCCLSITCPPVESNILELSNTLSWDLASLPSATCSCSAASKPTLRAWDLQRYVVAQSSGRIAPCIDVIVEIVRSNQFCLSPSRNQYSSAPGNAHLSWDSAFLSDITCSRGAESQPKYRALDLQRTVVSHGSDQIVPCIYVFVEIVLSKWNQYQTCLSPSRNQYH